MVDDKSGDAVAQRKKVIPFATVDVPFSGVRSFPGRFYIELEMKILKVRSDYQEMKESYSPPSSGPLWGTGGIFAAGLLALFSGAYTDVYAFTVVTVITAVSGLGALIFGLQVRREHNAAQERFKRMADLLDFDPAQTPSQ